MMRLMTGNGRLGIEQWVLALESFPVPVHPGGTVSVIRGARTDKMGWWDQVRQRLLQNEL